MISPHLNTMLARAKANELEDSHCTRADPAAARTGLSVEAMAEVDRIIARGVQKTVAAARTAVIEATLRPGMTEREAALWAATASRMVPTLTRRVALALEASLRTAIEQDQGGSAENRAAFVGPEACS